MISEYNEGDNVYKIGKEIFDYICEDLERDFTEDYEENLNGDIILELKITRKGEKKNGK